VDIDHGSRSAGRYFGLIHRFAKRYFAAEMERLGLPTVAFPLMMRLLHRDGVSQEDLAEEVRVDKATIARHLRKLEEAGLITRVVDEEDRRIKRVQVTDRAHELAPRIRAVGRAWSERLLDNFTAEEEYAALGLLRRMAENAREYWQDVGETPGGNQQQADGD